MKPRHRAAAVVLIGAVAGGCAGEKSRAAAAAFSVDTVGDTIIARSTGSGEWGGTATVTEELRIGQLDGPEEYTFGNVDAIAVGGDGTIYVLDAQANVVRRYDATGKHIASFARAGEGPGELKQPHSIAVLPDGRVAVRDFGLGRISLFDPEGSSVATYKFPATNFYTSDPMYVDRDGTMYTQVIHNRQNNGSWDTGLIPIRADGSIGDTMRNPYDFFQAAEVRAVKESNGGRSSSSSNVPFAPQAVTALSLDGTWIGGISDRYAIEVHQPDGKIRRIERAAEPVPVQQGEKDAMVEEITRSMRNVDAKWNWNGEKPGDVKPYFKSILVAQDGRLWVQLSTPATKLPPDPDAEPDEQGRMPVERWREARVYDVFESDGRYLGAVELPPRFYPQVMRGDEVWGDFTDEDGVGYVVKYRLGRDASK